MKQYSIDSVIFTYGPAVLSEGCPRTGDVISVERTNASTTIATGIRTQVAVLNGDKSGVFTITLLAASPQNAFLSDKLNEQENEDKLFHAPAQVKDFNGAELHFGAETFIAGHPVTGYAADGEPTRTWTLQTGVLEMKHGPSKDV